MVKPHIEPVPDTQPMNQPPESPSFPDKPHYYLYISLTLYLSLVSTPQSPSWFWFSGKLSWNASLISYTKIPMALSLLHPTAYVGVGCFGARVHTVIALIALTSWACRPSSVVQLNRCHSGEQRKGGYQMWPHGEEGQRSPVATPKPAFGSQHEMYV